MAVVHDVDHVRSDAGDDLGQPGTHSVWIGRHLTKVDQWQALTFGDLGRTAPADAGPCDREVRFRGERVQVVDVGGLEAPDHRQDAESLHAASARTETASSSNAR